MGSNPNFAFSERVNCSTLGLRFRSFIKLAFPFLIFNNRHNISEEKNSTNGNYNNYY